MKKRNTIIYWIATLWLALGMASSGIMQLLQGEAEREFITDLGYPIYVLTILGAWKIAGVIAILIPKQPMLKEWAYAGFFFMMSGAMFSHVAAGDPLIAAAPATLLLVLAMTSWYMRPADKKCASASTRCSGEADACCKKEMHS